MNIIDEIIKNTDNIDKIIRIYFIDKSAKDTFSSEDKSAKDTFSSDIQIFQYKNISNDDIIKCLSPKIEKKQNGRFIKSSYRNLVNIKSDKADGYFTVDNKLLGASSDILVSSVDIKMIDKECFPCLSKYNNTIESDIVVYDYDGMLITSCNDRCYLEFTNKNPKKMIKTFHSIYSLLCL